MNYTTAVFDMDGTVLNTLGDLTDSMNYALEAAGHAHSYTEDDVRQFFGSGVTVAIVRALAREAGTELSDLEQVGTANDTITDTIDAAEVQKIQEIYTPYYAAHCDIKTGPYAGILEVLEKLRAAGIKTAVVSNKPDYAVKTLSEQYFPGLLAASAGAKDGVRKKPCPDAVFEVVRQLGAEALRAVYIGDSEVDVATARNAGMPCISVSWGFRDRDVLVNAGAETICDSMDALYRALREG